MTLEEYAAVIEWLEDRWPGTRVYAKADLAFRDFEPYEADQLATAARLLFMSGLKNAPPLSMVLNSTIEQARISPKQQPPSTSYCLEFGHLWAIVEFEETSDDGLRHGVCVRCRKETRGTEETLPTAGELEERTSSWRP